MASNRARIGSRARAAFDFLFPSRRRRLGSCHHLLQEKSADVEVSFLRIGRRGDLVAMAVAACGKKPRARTARSAPAAALTRPAPPPPPPPPPPPAPTPEPSAPTEEELFAKMIARRAERQEAARRRVLPARQLGPERRGARAAAEERGLSEEVDVDARLGRRATATSAARRSTTSGSASAAPPR